MAITTLATVRSLLQLTDTDKDAWISALIPKIESDYEHIRGKPFDKAAKVNIATTGGLSADEEIEIEIGNSASVGGTASGLEYDITLRASDTADMIAYRIINGIKPSGYFNFILRDAGTTSADIYITERFPELQEYYSVLDVTITSSTELTATVSKMQTVYPDGAELTAAQMIQHQMSKPAGVQSESLGDYSVTYGAMGQGGYPQAITGQIVRFAVTQ
jgi:hypothetical protein